MLRKLKSLSVRLEALNHGGCKVTVSVTLKPSQRLKKQGAKQQPDRS